MTAASVSINVVSLKVLFSCYNFSVKTKCSQWRRGNTHQIMHRKNTNLTNRITIFWSHHVLWQTGTNITEVPSASTFRVKVFCLVNKAAQELHRVQPKLIVLNILHNHNSITVQMVSKKPATNSSRTLAPFRQPTVLHPKRPLPSSCQQLIFCHI
jgi:hypothetical protein